MKRASVRGSLVRITGIAENTVFQEFFDGSKRSAGRFCLLFSTLKKVGIHNTSFQKKEKNVQCVELKFYRRFTPWKAAMEQF